MKALLAVAGILWATSASATIVQIAPLVMASSFSHHGHQDLNGWGTPFADAFNFSLEGETWVSGVLNTEALLPMPDNIPSIDIQSVMLRGSNITLRWSEVNPPIDWAEATGGFERWSFAPQLLAAGVWRLEVTGVSFSDKTGNGYTANLELPEPGSVVLTALALAGAGGARLRRRQADVGVSAGGQA